MLSLFINITIKLNLLDLKIFNNNIYNYIFIGVEIIHICEYKKSLIKSDKLYLLLITYYNTIITRSIITGLLIYDLPTLSTLF